VCRELEVSRKRYVGRGISVICSWCPVCWWQTAVWGYIYEVVAGDSATEDTHECTWHRGNGDAFRALEHTLCPLVSGFRRLGCNGGPLGRFQGSRIKKATRCFGTSRVTHLTNDTASHVRRLESWVQSVDRGCDWRYSDFLGRYCSLLVLMGCHDQRRDAGRRHVHTEMRDSYRSAGLGGIQGEGLESSQLVPLVGPEVSLPRAPQTVSLETTLSHLNPIHYLISCFFKIPSTTVSIIWSVCRSCFSVSSDKWRNWCSSKRDWRL
jgi:hypothetical protein